MIQHNDGFNHTQQLRALSDRGLVDIYNNEHRVVTCHFHCHLTADYRILITRNACKALNKRLDIGCHSVKHYIGLSVKHSGHTVDSHRCTEAVGIRP